MQEFNRATRLLEAKRYDKALLRYKQLLPHAPFKELYLNLGNCYHQLDQELLALDCYLRAADPSTPFGDNTRGEYPLALNNIGYLKYCLGDPESAIPFYHRALALDPLYGECIWNLANAELKLSNSRTGWDKYEYRFNRGPSSVPMDSSIPRWNFSSSGDTITVVTEQGIGDKIQFARYLPLLREYFDRIIVACHPGLADLFPGYETTPRVTGDLIVPLCSLAKKFGVVAPVDGYSKERVSLSGFNIGVVASGSKTHVNDRNRSTQLGYFARLARFGRLWSLNPQEAKHKCVTPSGTKTWTETIQFIRALDLVVSVDTSIVHLAGTLGVPTLMLQPKRDTDFRWGMPGVENAWYPSVKIIDNPNSWHQVFDVVEGVVDAYHKQTRH